MLVSAVRVILLPATKVKVSVSESATDDPLALPPLADTAKVEKALAAVFELAIVTFLGLLLAFVVIDIPDPALQIQ